MSWFTAGAVGVDFETNGVNPLTARIVTACVAYRSENGGGWTRTWLADAGGESIPDECVAIHSVTTEKAHREGEPVADVAEAVREQLQDAWANGMPVVAMNAAFDLSLLNAELLRAGHRALSIDGPVLDPLVLDRAVDKYRRGRRNLTALCEHYQVSLTASPGEDTESAAGAHDATADVLGALRVLWRIGKRYPALAATSLGDLHTLQVDAHREWAEHFAEYKASRGETVDDLSTDWPLRVAVPA